MRFAVLYGSTRSDRQGIKAARFIVRHLQARDHDVTLLDACHLDLPMLDRMHKEYSEGEAPRDMQWAHEVLEAAEGYVVVSGEYNHSIPPGLKNLIDHYQREYFFKPAGICTYSAGPFAGARVSVHLRAILGELGMTTPSVMFGISKVGSAFTEDGEDASEDGSWDRRVQRFLDELEWHTDALRAKRERDGTPY